MEVKREIKRKKKNLFNKYKIILCLTQKYAALSIHIHVHVFELLWNKKFNFCLIKNKLNHTILNYIICHENI